MTVRPRRVLLVGMMGVGKTTIGRLLGARLGAPYVDNDELLDRSTGRTARELLDEGGVPALRAGEAAALELALREPPPLVAGVAAGVVLDPATRRRLRAGGDLVWLRAAPATLVRRTRRDPGQGPDHRPGLADPDRPIEWFERESEARAPLYADVARVVVDVDRPDGTDVPPARIVDTILARLAEQPAGRAPRPAD